MFQRKSDNLWVEVVKVDGKDKRITAKSKTALKQKLTALELLQEHGELFGTVADLWQEAHEKNIEATTGSAYTAHVKRAKEFFTGQHINDITPAQIQGFIDDLGRQGYARDTVHRAKVILNQIFNFAITMPGSTLRYNPVTAVKLPRGLNKTRREPPTADQLIKVNPDTEMGLFACFLLYTGMRRGEMLALQWKDIDKRARVITVSDVVQYDTNSGHIKDHPKTEAGTRKIPIPDELYKVLPKGKHTGYVFGGCKPFSASQFRKKWLDWCRENGLAESEIRTFKGKNGKTYEHEVWLPKVTPHQFRHQYATTLYHAGVDELDTKSIMGHSSITVTRDIYQHISERDKKSNAASKLNDYYKNNGKSEGKAKTKKAGS